MKMLKFIIVLILLEISFLKVTNAQIMMAEEYDNRMELSLMEITYNKHYIYHSFMMSKSEYNIFKNQIIKGKTWYLINKKEKLSFFKQIGICNTSDGFLSVSFEGRDYGPGVLTILIGKNGKLQYQIAIGARDLQKCIDVLNKPTIIKPVDIKKINSIFK